jgi:hypothetical protein
MVFCAGADLSLKASNRRRFENGSLTYDLDGAAY